MFTAIFVICAVFLATLLLFGIRIARRAPIARNASAHLPQLLRDANGILDACVADEKMSASECNRVNQLIQESKACGDAEQLIKVIERRFVGIQHRFLAPTEAALLADEHDSRHIDLMFSDTSDDDLKLFKSLTNLEDLRLGNTQITDEGLAQLNSLKKLKTLDIGENCISDIGLKHLERLNNLEQLYLHKTEITDAGLGYLKGLTKLKQLTLHGSGVTATGVADLRRSLPQCKITLNGINELYE